MRRQKDGEMMDLITKRVCGQGPQVLVNSDMEIRRTADKNGEVVMTGYRVFPGIELVFNDIHTQRCVMDHGRSGNVIEIDHCREGRIEREFGDEFFYLAPGDLAIGRKTAGESESYFPLSRYHGITIIIDIESAPRCLSCFLADVNVSPSAIAEKFCSDGRCFVARSKPYVEHIFSELYDVPDSIKKGYFKVKVLELLLVLLGMESGEDEAGSRSLAKRKVELAKDVSHYLTGHMEQHVTVAELADMFHVSQTVLKSAFKGVYGVPVYSYMRTQKMQSAAIMLKQTDMPVLEIAGRCGYDNGSKFAAAFRDVMGMSPNEYRNTANIETNSSKENHLGIA